jgi:hypothetical protein
MSTEILSSTEFRLADRERRMNGVVAHLSHREQTASDMATAMRVVQELG